MNGTQIISKIEDIIREIEKINNHPYETSGAIYALKECRGYMLKIARAEPLPTPIKQG